MLGWAARRLVEAAATLLGASALVWALVLLAPGDPARSVLAASGITQPNRAQLVVERRQLGLDRSPVSRYLHWLGGAVHGDLGTSWASGGSVTHDLAIRLPATLRLTTASLVLSLLLSVGLALVAAWAPGRWQDTLVRLITLGWLVVPGFLLGTLLLDIVVVRWNHFRVVADGRWDTVLLPAVTLSLGAAAVWSRQLRASLLEAGGATYDEVARARGAGRARRLVTHSLPNSTVPFLNVVGIGVAGLLAGATIVETVFSWPGVCAYAVSAIAAQDVPVIQGFTMLAVLVFVVASALVDLIAAVIDPRLRSPGSWRRRRRPVEPVGPLA